MGDPIPSLSLKEGFICNLAGDIEDSGKGGPREMFKLGPEAGIRQSRSRVPLLFRCGLNQKSGKFENPFGHLEGAKGQDTPCFFDGPNSTPPADLTLHVRQLGQCKVSVPLQEPGNLSHEVDDRFVPAALLNPLTQS